jgi:hypothetical protein
MNATAYQRNRLADLSKGTPMTTTPTPTPTDLLIAKNKARAVAAWPLYGSEPVPPKRKPAAKADDTDAADEDEPLTVDDIIAALQDIIDAAEGPTAFRRRGPALRTTRSAVAQRSAQRRNPFAPAGIHCAG